MRKWIDKKLLILILHYVLQQEKILHEMMITPKTTYRYACLNLGLTMYELKIEIFKALLSKQYNQPLELTGESSSVSVRPE